MGLGCELSGGGEAEASRIKGSSALISSSPDRSIAAAIYSSFKDLKKLFFLNFFFLIKRRTRRKLPGSQTKMKNRQRKSTATAKTDGVGGRSTRKQQGGVEKEPLLATYNDTSTRTQGERNRSEAPWI